MTNNKKLGFKLLQIFFFLLMVTHNVFSVFVNIFDHYPLPDYSIDNYLSRFFWDYFHNDYWGMAWYLVGMIGTRAIDLILLKVFKQRYMDRNLLYGMIIFTIICGFWNFKLSISVF